MWLTRPTPSGPSSSGTIPATAGTGVIGTSPLLLALAALDMAVAPGLAAAPLDPAEAAPADLEAWATAAPVAAVHLVAGLLAAAIREGLAAALAAAGAAVPGAEVSLVVPGAVVSLAEAAEAALAAAAVEEDSPAAPAAAASAAGGKNSGSPVETGGSSNVANNAEYVSPNMWC